MNIHKSVTLNRVLKLREKDLRKGCQMAGICIACGSGYRGVYPKAHEHMCYACFEMKVYGVEALLMMLRWGV